MMEKTFIEKGIKRVELEQYLKKQLIKAGFTHSDIIKTPLVTRIVANVTKPGLAIGKAGQNIRQLTETVEKEYGIENPQIEIKQIENPKLSAQAMVDDLKAMIDRGFTWRSVAFRMIGDIMDNGAQGVELIVKGKLAGKGGRKRKVRIAQGYMKKVGNQTKYVDFAQTAVYPKAGAIGIKLKIVKPDTIFPDKVSVKNYAKGKLAMQEAEAEQAKEVELEADQKIESKPKKEKPKKEKKEKSEKKKPAKEEKEAPVAETKPAKIDLAITENDLEVATDDVDGSVEVSETKEAEQ